MKNTFRLLLIATLASILLNSCGNTKSEKTENNNDSQTENNSVHNNTEEKLIITDKIMYDVTIVNEVIGDRSKNSPDWFWENLPTPDADNFIKNLLLDAISGKLKTYYYDMTGDYESFDEIPTSELKNYMDGILTYEYESVDTTVKRYKPELINIPLDYRNIKKLRFLEEWFVADGVFHKRVIAIAPYFTIEYPDMEPINAVYFWIMINQQ
jgi:hypothetical protein